MHFYSLLALCLAASVTALPGTPAMREGQKKGKTVCTLPFNAGDQKTAKNTWDKSGAGDFLRDFLTKKGVNKWIDELFEATVGGGTQGGSTYNCGNFPAEGGCTSPGHHLCTQYDPPEMFYVHLSIANYYAAFVQIHEAMQDSLGENLASGIKDIVALYGPPEPSNNWIMSLFVGGMVGASGLTKGFGRELTGLVGALLMTSATMDGEDPAETDIDLEGKLEDSLGDFYRAFGNKLEQVVDSIFVGDFSGIKGFDEDPVDWIVNQFSDGKMVDHTRTNPAVDNWIDRSKQMMQQALVIRAMKDQEWFVWLDWSRNKEECKERDGHTLFMFNLCVSLAKEYNGYMAGSYPSAMFDRLYEPFVDDYGFDYQQTILKSIACNGGEPDFSAIPPLNDGKVKYPDCFFNFELRLQDDYGAPPPEGVDAVLSFIFLSGIGQLEP